MATRFLRGTAIAAGVAVVAGFGLGLAAGEPVDPADLPAARKLPGDLCQRLGDVSPLLPRATNGSPKLAQTGAAEVRCRVAVDEKTQPTFTSAALAVAVTPYGAKVGGSGAPPIPAETVARQVYDRKPWIERQGRPYPTKVERSALGEEHWRLTVLVVRADVVVQVDYTAQPITRDVAERAALVIADRAVWESR